MNKPEQETPPFGNGCEEQSPLVPKQIERTLQTGERARRNGLVGVFLLIGVGLAASLTFYPLFGRQHRQHYACRWIEILHPIDDADGFATARFGSTVQVAENGQRVAIGDGGHAKAYLYWPEERNNNTNGTYSCKSDTISMKDIAEYSQLFHPGERCEYFDSVSSISMSRDGERIALCGKVAFKIENTRNAFWPLCRWATVVGVFAKNKTQVGPTLKHYEDSGDRFKSQNVAISPDGNTLAILGSIHEPIVEEIWSIRTYRLNSKSRTWDELGGHEGSINLSDMDFFAERTFQRPRMALSGDGNRLVVGGIARNMKYNEAPFCFAQRFSIRVYDWKGNRWIETQGSPIYDQSEEHEHYTTVPVAISRDGRRIAYGMPGYHLNGCSYKYVPGIETKGHWESHFTCGFEGKVTVLDMVDGKARRLGNILHGSESFQRFGYSLDMSGDGSRLVVGSLQTRGCIYAYDFNATRNEWVQIAPPKRGSGKGDSIGGSVAVDTSGEYVATGNFFGSQDKEAYLFRLSCD